MPDSTDNCTYCVYSMILLLCLKMQIVSLFVFTFFVLMVIEKYVTILGDESALQKSLVDFLELQMDYCGTLPLCTIKAENNRSLQTVSATCCKSCSCDTTCVDMGTCCPDFSLTSLDVDIVMANLSDKHHLRKYSKLFERELQERETKNHPHLNCIDAKMTKHAFRFEHMSSFYWMVDSCMNDTSDGVKAAINCNRDMYQSDEFDPDLFVPVTSLKTNTTYKNVYCYRCNEHDDGSSDILPWTVNFVCFHYYAHSIFENPYNQMKVVASNSMSFTCNILYKPTNHIQHLVSRCKPQGIKSCPDGSDVQLNEICELYHLPFIAVKTGITFQRYKNIACYLCNEQELLQSDCSTFYPKTNPFTVEMNLLFDRHGAVLQNDTRSKVLNVSVGEDFGRNSSCKTGFIRSADMVTCKRVLCPRHFYPLNGSCIPAFTVTENVCYTVVMEVLRVQKIDRTSKNIFRQIYTDTVAQLAARLFERFTFGLWEMTENYDVLILTFTMQKETAYSKAITSFSRFLTKIAFVKINTRLAAVDVVTLISKDSTLVFFGGKLHRKGKIKTPLPSWKTYHRLGEILKELRLSTSNLCYCAEFGPTEIYLDKMTKKIYVTKTGKMLFTIDAQEKDKGILVCLEDFYDNLTDKDASYMFGISRERVMAEYTNLQLKARHSPDATDTDTQSFLDYIAGSAREVVITVVVVLVVAVICMVKMVKKRATTHVRRGMTVDTD